MSITAKVILGVLIVLGSFLILVGTFGASGSEIVLVEMALGSLLKYLALLIIAASALLLLGKAASSRSLSETLPLTIPAVIGLFILAPHWVLGIYLAVLAIGHFTQKVVQSKCALPSAGDSHAGP